MANVFKRAMVHFGMLQSSPATLDDLRKLGYTDEVISALDCVTKREGEDCAALFGFSTRSRMAV
jgi:hypothetical protein